MLSHPTLSPLRKSAAVDSRSLEARVCCFRASGAKYLAADLEALNQLAGHMLGNIATCPTTANHEVRREVVASLWKMRQSLPSMDPGFPDRLENLAL